MESLTLSPSQWETLSPSSGRLFAGRRLWAAGRSGGPRSAVLSVTNELHSAVRFRMLPQEQLENFIRLEEQGLELIGIFHSHPNGPPHPSGTDLAEFTYPGVIYVICWRENGSWELKGFWTDGKTYREIPVNISAAEA